MSSRPVLSLPRTPLEITLEIAAGAGVVWMVGLAIFSYSALPAVIPTHFGLGGEPDGWGPRWTILVLPAVGLALYLLLTLLGRIPHRLNYPWKITEANAARQYRLVRIFLTGLKTELVLSFCYIKVAAIRVTMGNASGLSPIFLPSFVGMTFLTILTYVILSYRAR